MRSSWVIDGAAHVESVRDWQVSTGAVRRVSRRVRPRQVDALLATQVRVAEHPLSVAPSSSCPVSNQQVQLLCERGVLRRAE
jgi:hypothetical protein